MKLKLVREAPETPLHRAAHWAVRQDRGALDDTEQAEFEAWVEEGENRLALAQADAALSLFDDLDPECQELASLRAEAAAHNESRDRRRWLPWTGGAIAASIAAALLYSVQIGGDIRPVSGPGALASKNMSVALPGEARYATAVGEQKVVKLADGSTITLNTGTEIEVDYRQDERIVRLVRGQALFDVAHAADRPFAVIVSGRKVTALGTVFEVRLDTGRLRVILLRGRVRVDEKQPASNSAAATLPSPVFLSPGEQFSAVSGLAPVVQSVNVEQKLLWRQSLVEFDDEPLGEAVAELNRYSATQIAVADDRVGDLRISGIVKAGDTEAFTSLVGAMLPVASRRNAKGEVILYHAP